MPRYLLLCSFFMLCLFLTSPVLGQRSIRIRGTVVQSDKTTPIPGAGITRAGTTMGVVSDADGNFLIDINSTDTLLIRAIGFKPLLYLPQRLPVSEIRVNIVMQEDSVLLGEVEITNRPSEEMIQRALRNIKRDDPDYARRPGYNPANEPPPPPPAEAAKLDNPFAIKIDAIYEMLSSEGKQRKKLNVLLQQQEFERRMQERKKAIEDYNRLFKDNSGYR